MNRIVTQILEIDDGDIVTFAGNYDFYVKEREIRGSDVRDVSDDYALVAVQGPRALERLELPAAPDRVALCCQHAPAAFAGFMTSTFGTPATRITGTKSLTRCAGCAE